MTAEGNQPPGEHTWPAGNSGELPVEEYLCGARFRVRLEVLRFVPVAQRFGYTQPDLWQVVNASLAVSLPNFNGGNWPAFARTVARRRLIDLVRAQVPGGRREMRAMSLAQLGASTVEAAEAVGVSEGRLVDAIGLLTPAGLDAFVRELPDQHSDPPDAALLRQEMKKRLFDAIQQLPPRECRVVLSRLSEVPDELLVQEWNVTPGRISQLYTQALRRLELLLGRDPR